jgi:hypothetical protein
MSTTPASGTKPPAKPPPWATRDPKWHGSWFGFVTNGGHWKDTDALRKDLQNQRKRYLWETDIPPRRTDLSLAGPAPKSGYVLDINDAVAIIGLSKGDLRADLQTSLRDDVIVPVAGQNLTILSHTSGWDDIIGVLILCERSTIGRPKDMKQRGGTYDYVSALLVEGAISKEVSA